ncbi:MAG: biopolymer transporter ExbD [Casimicrobiaceae bacterium]|nr:biopolymer transporter ExbD [Casimicrobiaceae bacterium]MCX8099028.1 biopolymer transporter ExbD [Casimicrobiaceae bacterium]MDW8312908.1 biopolymer transporter ExbD [Burkholderiales bacterium]
MNFRKGRFREEPEINLIPLIDVLLVILIFLMASTTYSRLTELKITLPEAEAEKQQQRPKEVLVGIDAQGRYALNKTVFVFTGVPALAQALKEAAQGANDVVVIINADAAAKHQDVVNVMEAARAANLTQITFATQAPAR